MSRSNDMAQPSGEVYNEVTAGQAQVVPFDRLDKRTAHDLFTALPQESKWGEVTMALLAGDAVFVPSMTRNQLESVRTIVNRRAYGKLKSRTTEVDGVAGRVLRIKRAHEDKAAR
jgi:hypothetical protein